MDISLFEISKDIHKFTLFDILTKDSVHNMLHVYSPPIYVLQAPFVGKYHLNVMDQGNVISAVSAEMTTTNQV